MYARIRPMFGRDAGQPELFTITDSSLEYRKEAGADLTKYNFDRVFGMDSKQEDVYESIGDVALSSLQQGFNSTIMAYGQTGSGKTFSMEGAKDGNGNYTSRGLIPRLFTDVFERFNADPEVKSYEVSLQYIELYNEQLQDLFGNRKVVDVTMDPTGGYQCRDAVRIVCKDAVAAQRAYADGCKMRATASTKMNAESSRSHALLQLNVRQQLPDGCTKLSQLNIADLAGSEKVDKSGSSGETLEEAKKINASLSALGARARVPPPRNSRAQFSRNSVTGALPLPRPSQAM